MSNLKTSWVKLPQYEVDELWETGVIVRWVVTDNSGTIHHIERSFDQVIPFAFYQIQQKIIEKFDISCDSRKQIEHYIEVVIG